MSYFNSVAYNDLLKKAIGCSNPSSFFCNKHATIVWKEANENN